MKYVIVCILWLMTACVVLADDSTLRNDSFNTLPDSNTATFRAQSRTFLDHESAQREGTYRGAFVSAGGWHGTSASLTSSVMTTEAFVPERINQIGTAIVYTTSTTNICWLIISSDNDGIASWNRVGTTAYYFNCQGEGAVTVARPTLPPNSAWLLDVRITGGAITTVTEISTRIITGVETLSITRRVGYTALWIVQPGGSIVHATGATFCGALHAGPYPIFTLTSTFTFCTPNRTASAYAEWWGAVGNGVLGSSGAAIGKAIQSGVGHVQLLSDTNYIIEVPIVWNRFAVNLQGFGRTTYLTCSTSTLVAIIDFEDAGAGAMSAIIDGVRFNGFCADGTNFTGKAIRATTATFIDSILQNCWFGLSNDTTGAFYGRAVNSSFLNNVFELGGTQLNFTNPSSGITITGLKCFRIYDECINFIGLTAGDIAHAVLTDIQINEHNRGSAIKARYAHGLTIQGLNFESSNLVDTYTIKVLDLQNTDAQLSNIRTRGYIAGGTLTKITQVLETTNSEIVWNGGYIGGTLTNGSGTTNAIRVLAGTVTLLVQGVFIDDMQADAVVLQSAVGSVSLKNNYINAPINKFLNMTGVNTADIILESNTFQNANFNLAVAASAFVINTTGVVRVANNLVVSNQAWMDPFFAFTTLDANATVENNTFVGAPGVIFSGSVFRQGFNRGQTGQYVAAAMPIAGNYTAGDEVVSNGPAVLGGAGSQYVIRGWKRLTTGGAHVLNTDWVEMRTLTGT